MSCEHCASAYADGVEAGRRETTELLAFEVELLGKVWKRRLVPEAPPTEAITLPPTERFELVDLIFGRA